MGFCNFSFLCLLLGLTVCNYTVCLSVSGCKKLRQANTRLPSFTSTHKRKNAPFCTYFSVVEFTSCPLKRYITPPYHGIYFLFSFSLGFLSPYITLNECLRYLHAGAPEFWCLLP